SKRAESCRRNSTRERRSSGISEPLPDSDAICRSELLAILRTGLAEVSSGRSKVQTFPFSARFNAISVVETPLYVPNSKARFTAQLVTSKALAYASTGEREDATPATSTQ